MRRTAPSEIRLWHIYSGVGKGPDPIDFYRYKVRFFYQHQSRRPLRTPSTCTSIIFRGARCLDPKLETWNSIVRSPASFISSIARKCTFSRHNLHFLPFLTLSSSEFSRMRSCDKALYQVKLMSSCTDWSVSHIPAQRYIWEKHLGWRNQRRKPRLPSPTVVVLFVGNQLVLISGILDLRVLRSRQQ